jgi:hypothetical protein
VSVSPRRAKRPAAFRARLSESSTQEPALFRIVRTASLALAALTLVNAPLSAQMDPQAPARIARAKAALAPLANLVGEWEGPANAMVGRGQSRTFTQHELVEWGSMGTAMIVRGTGRSTEPANAGAIEFEATAIIWVNEETGAIQMRTHRDGRSVELDVEVRPDTIIWGFAVPGGRIRYTIAFTATSWHEVGEFIRDGGQPIKTMEMRLARKRS